MAQDDDTDPKFEDISSRSPFLPPCTPAQANAALQNQLPGLGSGLAGLAPANTMGGLAADLGAAPLVFPHFQAPGLASQLAGRGITAVSGCDPRLVNVTTNAATPSFQTANGTIITMNKSAPNTTLPWGEGLDRLIKFADGTGLDSVKISGGTELADAKGNLLHSPNSDHPKNLAIDVSGSNDLDDETVRRAALAAGYTHGMYEIKPDGTEHWHLQVGPDNIHNAQKYDLNAGPMKTVSLP